MKLLLDTHVWIWLMNGNSELSKASIKTINQADELYIAAISLWELGMLESKKRIILDMPALEWINYSLDISDITIKPLTASIAIDSCHLPGSFHEDPADRMIVATTRVENLTLLTRDTRILNYAKQKHVSCLKV